MREHSFKEGIPAEHSRLPDGPNPEYDDGGPYLQELVFLAEYDTRETQYGNRTEDPLDWGGVHLRAFGDHYREKRGHHPDSEDEVLPHKRLGE